MGAGARQTQPSSRRLGPSGPALSGYPATPGNAGSQIKSPTLQSHRGEWCSLCSDLNCRVPQPFTFFVKGAGLGPSAKARQVNSCTTPHVLGSEVYTSISQECRKSAQPWTASNKFSS